MAVTDYHSANAAMRPAELLQAVKVPFPVLIYVFTVVLPIGFWAGPMYMTTLRLFLLIMTVPLMFNVLTGKYGKIYLTDYLFVAHIFWAALAIGINNPDRMIQQVGSVGIEFLGGYAVGRAYIRSKGDFMGLCRLLIVIVFCTLPFGVFEALTGRPIIIEILHKIPLVTSVEILSIDIRLGLERVQNVFAHPIHYGLFCSVVFSLCYVALQGTMSSFRRVISSILIAASGFLALSSGALTAIAMQIAFIFWATIFRNFRWRWWLLVGLFVMAYVAVDLMSNRGPIKVFMSYATFSTHNAYYRATLFEWGMANIMGDAIKGIAPSPIIGIGLADWIRPSYMHSSTMDNFWLLVAMRYGIPGLIFMALGYFIIIFKVMRRDYGNDERLILLRRAWVFTFLGLTFTLCTVHVWTNIYSFIFFMFGAGVWLITAQSNENEEEAPPAQDPQGRLHTRGQVRIKHSHNGASPGAIRYSRFPKR